MEYSHTILQKLLTMQMRAPLCKSVHQIVSEQEIQLSFTWAASIIPSSRWLWHGSNFWGRSSSCSLIPSSGALVSMDIYPFLSIVFHTCRVHCKDEQGKKSVDSWTMPENLGTSVSSLTVLRHLERLITSGWLQVLRVAQGRGLTCVLSRSPNHLSLHH